MKKDAPIISLKRGKADSAYFGHPWVFSGALAHVPQEVRSGDWVRVSDAQGRVVGMGTYSARSMIAVRLFAFGREEVDAAWVRQRVLDADKRRLLLGYGPNTDTTGYRMVFGESDGLPGLVIDRYADVFVYQASTAGAQGLAPVVEDVLQKDFPSQAVFFRNDLPSRQEEGLALEKGQAFGTDKGPVRFLENGLCFLADCAGGQKTGFYLDQKDLRKAVRSLSAGRRVLNLFSYTGAFAVAALSGGAKSVHNVDASEEALSFLPKHVRQNGMDPSRVSMEQADAFAWLQHAPKGAFDMVILDPPALIKAKSDIEKGRRAYYFLNKAALSLLDTGGILISSSCSHWFSEDDLFFTLRRAAAHNGRRLFTLLRAGQSPDHPVSITFPESSYLKSLALLVQ